MAGRISQANLVGVRIAAVAAAAWTLWGASGLHDSASVVVRVVGIVLAVLILVVALRQRRGEPRAQRSMFATQSYRVTVAVEAVTLAVGAVLLSRTGHSEYIIAWTAAVVGLHFLIFGRLFAARFYLLGAALIAAAIIGAAINIGGASQDQATAATGLIAAASLLLTAGMILVSRPQAPG